MTILCEPDRKTARALRSMLDDSVHTVADLPAAALTIANDPAQRVVVVGSELAIEQVLSFSGQVRLERPEVQVILLRNEVDEEVRAAAEGAGISAVVAAGDVEELSQAYQSVSQGAGNSAPEATERDDDVERGRVITLFSAKGGTGRTAIACNLAAALNAGGQRSVCLVDLDLAFGDVAISLSVTPNRTFIDAASPDAEGQPEDHVDALVTQYRPGFDCILAPVEPGDAESVPAELVTLVLREMSRRYHYVVVDLPAQFSEHVLVALDEADIHLLVTTPEIPALKNLGLSIDMLDVLGYRPDSRGVVLNQSDLKGGIAPDQVEASVRAPVWARLPYSKDLPAAVNAGQPLLISKPDAAFSEAVQHFAEASILGVHSDKSRRRFGRRESRARK